MLSLKVNVVLLLTRTHIDVNRHKSQTLYSKLKATDTTKDYNTAKITVTPSTKAQ